jgi:hypothetical protein
MARAARRQAWPAGPPSAGAAVLALRDECEAAMAENRLLRESNASLYRQLVSATEAARDAERKCGQFMETPAFSDLFTEGQEAVRRFRSAARLAEALQRAGLPREQAMFALGAASSLGPQLHGEAREEAAAREARQQRGRTSGRRAWWWPLGGAGAAAEDDAAAAGGARAPRARGRSVSPVLSDVSEE